MLLVNTSKEEAYKIAVFLHYVEMSVRKLTQLHQTEVSNTKESE